MDAETRVRVMEHGAAHPTLWGAEGKVMWTCLKNLIVMVLLDKVAEGAPKSACGVRFHSVAIKALEVIEP